MLLYGNPNIAKLLQDVITIEAYSLNNVEVPWENLDFSQDMNQVAIHCEIAHDPRSMRDKLYQVARCAFHNAKFDNPKNLKAGTVLYVSLETKMRSGICVLLQWRSSHARIVLNVFVMSQCLLSGKAMSHSTCTN